VRGAWRGGVCGLARSCAGVPRAAQLLSLQDDLVVPGPDAGLGTALQDQHDGGARVALEHRDDVAVRRALHGRRVHCDEGVVDGDFAAPVGGPSGHQACHRHAMRAALNNEASGSFGVALGHG
jgi:hypothetical protein